MILVLFIWIYVGPLCAVKSQFQMMLGTTAYLPIPAFDDNPSGMTAEDRSLPLERFN
jgi:hypothetical protein